MATRTGTYKIQVKRTKKNIDDPVIESSYLEFGEPFYMDGEDYFIVGPYNETPSSDSLIPDLKVTKLVNRELTDVDDSTSTIPVADNELFYKNKSSNIITVMDSETNPLYPRTKVEAITDSEGTALASLLINKVDIDTASLVRSTLGYDSGGVYVDEEVVDTSDIPSDLLSMINKKVSIDSESDPSFNPISLGQDLIGVFVRINDGQAEETNFIQSYINNEVSKSLNSITSQIAILQQMVAAAGGLFVGSNPPASLNQMWLDTAAITGGLKYYDNTYNAWKHIPVAYS